VTTPPNAFWAWPAPSLMERLGTTETGLTGSEAARRLRTYGPNQVALVTRRRGLRLFATQFTNPIILILVAATVLAMLLGDPTDGLIILVIIAASGVLGFWQEHRAGQAVDELLARVRVHVELLREGTEVSVPADQVVPGDVIVLRAGDIVPADCRVVGSPRNLMVDEAALTGESFPAEKTAAEVEEGAPLARRTNALFAGTHVSSGEGRAVVVDTGRNTAFADLVERLSTSDITTGFEKGMTRFGLLLVRAMLVLVIAILIVNLLLDRPWLDAVLFSLALAVGLTPQLLPAIVAVSLATGARRMAADKVIVKRLDAIEDFGGMTVLCTDKTGTLTSGAISLDQAVDLDGDRDPEVLRLAGINAALQQGFDNPIDTAVTAAAGPATDAAPVDEVPYDFIRKRLSILADDQGRRTLICKGAFDNVLACCTSAQRDGRTVPLAEVRDRVDDLFTRLSSAGFRVLAVAVKPMPDARRVDADDERDMTLRGLLAFGDAVKPDAAASIARLEALGVSLRLVTGDNRLAAAAVADAVGLPGNILNGPAIDALDDERLAEAVRTTSVFAEVEPRHKERIVTALQADGQVVGLLGDGINDSPALHAADVGISVDTAVDVAKQSASIVLLDKGLHVIADGVTLGRQTFANTLKYVRVTISANFGNMLSMALASAFLPFLPLLPRQILLLNLLSDIPAITISTDKVDPEQLATPRRWNLPEIRNFMIVFGSISSVFDLATFAVLYFGFHASPELFRTSWFIESLATELAAMLVLRTIRPFTASRPSTALLVSSIAIAVLALALPYLSWLAVPLGFTPPPGMVLAALAVLIIIYIGVNEAAKRLRPIYT